MHGRAHCLLCHLALIHVTRGLIVVKEGDLRWEDGEDVCRGELLVFRVVTDVFFETCDREVYLFEGSDPLELVHSEMLDGTDEPGFGGREEDPWEDVLLRGRQFRHVTDLEVSRD